MALRWEEAGVIVTCGDPRTLEEAPDDAIVIALKPEEADEPETIESVRNLVLDRTIERRRRILSDVYELGLSMPEPVQEELGSGAAHHNGQFDLDESALTLGVCTELAFALD